MEETNVVETYLPDEESIESFFGLSLKDKLTVVKLGLTFFNDGQGKLAEWQNQDAQTIIDDMKQRHAEEVDILNQKLDKAQIWVKEFETDMNSKQASLIQTAVEAQKASFSSEIEALRNRNEGLLSNLQSIQGELYEKHMTDISRREKDHEAKMDALRKEMAEMQSTYESRLNRSINSTLKGADGEEVVLGKLNMMFPTADIEDTHAQPHRGDFILRYDGITIMIETKNYSRNVQKAEIDKFYRDIDNPANSDLQGAIFVSMVTGICNKEDFQFEVRNGIPVLFMHNLCQNYEAMLIAIKFFKLVLDQDGLDLSSKEIKDSFKNVASTLKRNFNRQKSILDKYHTEQLQLISSQQANVADLFTVVKQKY